MAQENIILKVVYDTSEAIPSAKGLEKAINSTTKSTNELNSSLNTTQKEISEFDKNVKGGADGLKNLAQAKKNFNDISLVSSNKEVNELSNNIVKTKEQTIKAKDSFKELDNAIDKGVASVDVLKNRTEELAKKTYSFKAEMRQLSNDITSGKFKGDDLVIARQRLADMKDQASDLSNQTKILGSDTRALDTSIQGLSIGVSIFAGLQGASALFGSENENVQKALLKVNGAMAILQSLQTIQNALDENSGFLVSVKAYWQDLFSKSKKQEIVSTTEAIAVKEAEIVATESSIVATEAETIAKSEATIGNYLYGVALRVVTAIQTTFAVSSATAWAIATAGVTLLITGIGLLIYNYKEITKYVTDFLGITRELTKEQKLQKQYSDDIASVQKELIDNNTKEIANVITLGIAIKDQNLSRQERLKALQQYNELADKGNEIDIKQINNSSIIESAIKRQTDLIIKRAMALSAQSEIEKIAQSTLQARLEVSAVENAYGSLLKMSSQEINNLVKANDQLAISFVKNSGNYFKNVGVIEDGNKRIKKLVETFGLVDLKEKEVKVKVKADKVEVDPKDIQLKNDRSSLLNLIGGFTQALNQEITQLPLKEFSLSIPVMPEINIDKTLESIQGIQQAFESTASKSSQFGGLFSSIAGVTTSAFNVKELKNALAEQRIAIEFGKKQLALTTDEYNQKLKESEKQIEEALKTGNQERIKQAKETSEKLKEEYKKNIEDQKNAIKNAEENAQTLGEKLKAGVGDIVKGSLRVIGEVNNLIGASIDRNIARLDGLIEKQKVAVQDAKNIADKGNALQYEAEIKKQQKLEELRRQEAKKKKAIAISEIIINNAIGITDIWSKWASNPAVAGVLTGLLVALTGVQIGVVATQQFKKGGKVPTGMQKGASHEQGGIKFGVKGRNELYEFEGDEFIFNKETSLKNQKWFDKINRENLSLDELLGNRIKPMGLNPILSSTYVNQNGQLERRLIKVEQAILDLPERMPQTSFNADSRGLSMTMKRIIDKENSWKR